MPLADHHVVFKGAHAQHEMMSAVWTLANAAPGSQTRLACRHAGVLRRSGMQ